MAYTIEWLDEEQTILLTTYHEGWSWREFAAEASEPIIKIFEATPHPVYNIQYLQGRMPLPTIGWTGKIGSAGVMGHPKQKAVIVVADHRLAPYLANVFLRLFPQYAQQLIHVSTLDEARATIETLKAQEVPSAR